MTDGRTEGGRVSFDSQPEGVFITDLKSWQQEQEAGGPCVCSWETETDAGAQPTLRCL